MVLYVKFGAAALTHKPGFSTLQRIMTHESSGRGKKQYNGYVWVLLREENRMCKVKVSNLKYLGSQAGPC